MTNPTKPGATSDTHAAVAPSRAFDLLHPRIQRWVWQQQWPSLRPAQERAVMPILAAHHDVVICAATAAGKTEAAFLPICTTLLRDREARAAQTASSSREGSSAGPAMGIEVIYVSPLKALINDQWGRLDRLCEDLDIPVHRWHGDVNASHKARTIKHPAGILVITPESLEAHFVNRGTRLPELFKGLRYIVIDEMHAFLGNVRGAQLRSLMHRVDLTVRRRAPRIALSATIGDLGQAKAFLRADDPDNVEVIQDHEEGTEVRLQLRGYLHCAPTPAGETQAPTTGTESTDEDHADDQSSWEVAQHLFGALRGTSNLVFANRRDVVELYADRLARLCEGARVPVEFLPHHGSLSAGAREDVEARLRDGTRPTTAVCTSTLELGIDIGAVTSVAQIGSPSSVASLRQRLGRSGRRAGEVATLRMYITEDEVTSQSSPVDVIRAELVRSIAMIDLLLDRWYEPSDGSDLHLSTLTQQVLSLIAQHSGVFPADAYRAVCEHGPFRNVSAPLFAQLLRDLGAADLIVQSTDGLLLPGRLGERMINHYTFYAAFRTPEEYRLVAEGKPLGQIPINEPIEVGNRLIFSGRRWRVIAVSQRDKLIELTPSPGGRPPSFAGFAGLTHAQVHHRMLARYLTDDVPSFLDATAQRLLEEGRHSFRIWDLHQYPVMQVGSDSVLFCWRGDRVHTTIAALLGHRGIHASRESVTVAVPDTHPRELLQALRQIASGPPPDPVDLASRLQMKAVDKWDDYFGEDLLNTACAARTLDIPNALNAIHRLIDLWPESDAAAIPARTTQAAASHPSSAPQPAALSSPTIRRHEDGAQPITDTVFSVVDVETTGLSPALGHRIIEIAIVRADHHGAVLDRYDTLVNPRRDAGPTRVHGLTNADLVAAPTFAEITPDVVARLEGTVVVAHNAPFDLAFLSAELGRQGLRNAATSHLCTLELATKISPGLANHQLATCCTEQGIRLTGAHQALADAEATAALLAAYLRVLRQQGASHLMDLDVSSPHGSPRTRLPNAAAHPRRPSDVRQPPLNAPSDLPSSSHRYTSAGGQLLGHAARRVQDAGTITEDEIRELELLAARWRVPANERVGLWRDLRVDA